MFSSHSHLRHVGRRRLLVMELLQVSLVHAFTLHIIISFKQISPRSFGDVEHKLGLLTGVNLNKVFMNFSRERLKEEGKVELFNDCKAIGDGRYNKDKNEVGLHKTHKLKLKYE